MKQIFVNPDKKNKTRSKPLKEGEAWFRNMANNAPVMMWVANADKQRVFFNTTWLKFTGRTIEQELNDGWMENIYEEDRENFLKIYNLCFDERIAFRTEYRLRHRSGEYRWILSMGNPSYASDESFLGFIGTATEITQEVQARSLIKESEERFRQMADAMPHIVWMATAEGKLNYFNQGFYNYTGQPQDEEINEASRKIVHPDDMERAKLIWMHYLKGDRQMEGEVRFKRKDGEYRWHLVRGVPLKNKDGDIKMWVGTCTDIHDHKTLNEELEKRVEERTHDLQEINREMERSNSELQQFAYVASHDLQEPLRKIITFADRLQAFKDNVPDKGKLYLDKIVASSQRMTKLIDDLLNFSRISRTGSKFVQTNLNEILEKVLTDFEVIATLKNATITYQNLPVINAIPVQMEQLFHNLVANALKFAKKDVLPVITITARRVTAGEEEKLNGLDRERHYVEIVVRDNGIGFSNEFAEQIFIIFQRLNDRHTYPGTGIGLAVCRKISTNHGGKIYAVSKEDEGAAFYIILPIV